MVNVKYRFLVDFIVDIIEDIIVDANNCIKALFNYIFSIYRAKKANISLSKGKLKAKSASKSKAGLFNTGARLFISFIIYRIK